MELDLFFDSVELVIKKHDPEILKLESFHLINTNSNLKNSWEGWFLTVVGVGGVEGAVRGCWKGAVGRGCSCCCKVLIFGC